MTVWTGPRGPAAPSSRFDDLKTHAVPLLPAHSPYANALVEAVQRQDVREVLAALRQLLAKGLLFPTLGRTGVNAKHSQYSISAIEWQMRQPESPASRVILDLLLLNLDDVRRWQPSEEPGLCSIPVQAWARAALQAFQRARGRNAAVAQTLLYATRDDEARDILQADGIELRSSQPQDGFGTAPIRTLASAPYSNRCPPGKPRPRYQESYVRGESTKIQRSLACEGPSPSPGSWRQQAPSAAFSVEPDLVENRWSADARPIVLKQEEAEEGEVLALEPPVAAAASSNAVLSASAPLKVHPSRLANLGLDPAAARFRMDPYPTPSLSPSPPPPAPAQPISFYESRTKGLPLVSEQKEAFAASRIEATSDAAASSATGSGRAQAEAGPSELQPIPGPPREKRQRRGDDVDQEPRVIRAFNGKGPRLVSGRKIRSKTTPPAQASTLGTPSRPYGSGSPSTVPFSLPPPPGSVFSSTPTGSNVVSPLGLGWAPPAPAPTSVPLSPDPDPHHLQVTEESASCLGKRRRTSDGNEPTRKLTVRWKDDQLEEVLGYGAGHVEEAYCDADQEELEDAEPEYDEVLTDTEDEEDAVLDELLEQELVAQAVSTPEEGASQQPGNEALTHMLPQDASAIPSAWTWWYEC